MVVKCPARWWIKRCSIMQGRWKMREIAAPRVSVLMPTYKQAHFIRRAIDSLCAQTLTAWELIIVDDGSPDDTRAVLNSALADPRLQYQRLPHNHGLGA